MNEKGTPKISTLLHIHPIGIESIGIFYKENTAAPYGDMILHRSVALKGWGV